MRRCIVPSKMLRLLVCVATLFVAVAARGLREEFTWTRITYELPQNGQILKRQAQIGTRYEGNGDSQTIFFEGSTNREHVAHMVQMIPETLDGNVVPATIDYVYENNIPMGANVWRDKLFITVPRRRRGVPSALNYVPLNSPNKHNVPLIPYPDWRTNLYPDPLKSGRNIVSVYRIGIDPCDRMWFVDTGIVETLGNATQVQPTAIVAIDLTRDQVILRHEFPEEVLRPNSGLASVEVDVTRDTCGDAFVYIPDLSGFGVIVYSLRENRSWRVNHNYFYLDPQAGEFSIAGHRFQWSDGVFSLELTSIKPDGYRDLYFHAMASTYMYKVSTRIMRNESLATRPYHEDDFEIVGDRGPKSQTSQADIDTGTDIMFLNLINRNAVACWNTKLPLNTLSMVHRDDAAMIYPSDNKIADGKVYVLTNTMPGFLYGRLDYDRINFRVWVNTVREAVAGTKCNNQRID